MIQKISAFLGVVAILFSGFFFIDARYATAKDLDLLQQSVEYQRIVQRYETAVDLYYQYKALYRKYPDDSELKEELDAVKINRDELKKKIDNFPD